MNLFATAQTDGVFEFDGYFAKHLLRTLKPKSFTELYQICGLFHGTGTWTNNAESLIATNKASLSDVISVRDDITLGLTAKGIERLLAYEISEYVRKGKGLTAEHETLMREHKVPDWYIKSCKNIKYLFPKAYGVSVTIQAFRLAWFKAHYPTKFHDAHCDDYYE